MDVEGILAILLIFGGGTLFLLAISPVGKALAERIRHGRAVPLPATESDPAVWEELDRMRAEISELQERVDFAERMLPRGTPAAPDGVKQS